MLLLLGGFAWADEAADRLKIEASIGALYQPQVRADGARMGRLLTDDFDGDLESVPTRGIWRENSPPEVSFSIKALRFATPEIALVDGETNLLGVSTQVGMGANGAVIYTLPGPATRPWFMILKRDGDGWRIALFRSLAAPPATASARN